MASNEILPRTVATLEYIPSDKHTWYARSYTGEFRLARVAADSPEAGAYPAEIASGNIEVFDTESDDPFGGAFKRLEAKRAQENAYRSEFAKMLKPYEEREAAERAERDRQNRENQALHERAEAERVQQSYRISSGA